MKNILIGRQMIKNMRQFCHITLKENKIESGYQKHFDRYLLARFFVSGEFGREELELSGGVSVGDFGGSINWAIFRNTLGSQ